MQESDILTFLAMRNDTVVRAGGRLIVVRLRCERYIKKSRNPKREQP
jgi:hypothetical protein